MKFPAGTVAGHFKTAVAANSGIDIIRFNNQKLNWTLKEFDVRTRHPAINAMCRGTALLLRSVSLRLVSRAATVLCCTLIRRAQLSNLSLKWARSRPAFKS
jgi:hypothetical protein